VKVESDKNVAVLSDNPPRFSDNPPRFEQKATGFHFSLFTFHFYWVRRVLAVSLLRAREENG